MSTEKKPTPDLDLMVKVDHPEASLLPDQQTQRLAAQIVTTGDGLKPTAFYQHQILNCQRHIQELNSNLLSMQEEKAKKEIELAQLKERNVWTKKIEMAAGIIICVCTALGRIYPTGVIMIVANVLLVIAGVVVAVNSVRK